MCARRASSPVGRVDPNYITMLRMCARKRSPSATIERGWTNDNEVALSGCIL